MPIYMDRHDMSESVTAENVAQVHQEDLKVQHHFGCRGLTYWFDDKRKTAFCLIEAPDEKAIRDMHSKAHGDVPNSVIEVDISIVESFLGRIEDPEKAKDTRLNIINDPAFRTIMVIGMQDTGPGQSNQVKEGSLFNGFNEAVADILNRYEGKPVRQPDYQYLASFRSVSNAVHAAFDIQSLFKEYKKNMPDGKTDLKIGLSTGVPVTQKQLIFEESIKLAGRMCEIVKGKIIASPEVIELYKSENDNSIPESKNIFSLTRTEEQFLTQLMDYTESSWSNTNLKVDDFSKPLGCSKSQFYRKMILLTGKSPNTFIREYRLKEALKLLRRRAGNISEIAFETGFSSPSYFSKCFQKQYGRMPSECLPVTAD